MKKILNVILSLFLLLGMISCSNPSSSSDNPTDNSTSNSTGINIETEATADGIKITVPTIEGVNRYGIDRKNLKTGRYDSFYMQIFRNSTDHSFTDYFVEPGTTYEYKVHFRKESNQGSDFKVSNPKAEKAVNGSGELKSTVAPAGTFANNKITFTAMPEFSSKVSELLKNKKGYIPNFNIEYKLGENDSALNGEIKSSDFDCKEAMKNNNAYGKSLTLRRLTAEFTLEKVQYRYYSHLAEELPDMPKNIIVTK